MACIIIAAAPCCKLFSTSGDCELNACCVTAGRASKASSHCLESAEVGRCRRRCCMPLAAMSDAVWTLLGASSLLMRLRCSALNALPDLLRGKGTGASSAATAAASHCFELSASTGNSWLSRLCWSRHAVTGSSSASEGSSGLPSTAKSTWPLRFDAAAAAATEAVPLPLSRPAAVPGELRGLGSPAVDAVLLLGVVAAPLSLRLVRRSRPGAGEALPPALMRADTLPPALLRPDRLPAALLCADRPPALVRGCPGAAAKRLPIGLLAELGLE